MNHKEFLAEVQKSCQAGHQQCITLLSALLKLMVQAAIDQVPVCIKGLGTFSSHKHPEYIQENPKNGEQILCPPRISYRLKSESSEMTDEERGRELDADLAEYCKLPLVVAQSFLQAFAATVMKHIRLHEEVEIHGLGTFHLIEALQSELQRVAFSPDEQMRQQVNAPFNCFEPVVIREAQEEEVLVDEPEAEKHEEDEIDTSAEESASTGTDSMAEEPAGADNVAEESDEADTDKLAEEKPEAGTEVEEEVLHAESLSLNAEEPALAEENLSLLDGEPALPEENPDLHNEEPASDDETEADNACDETVPAATAQETEAVQAEEPVQEPESEQIPASHLEIESEPLPSQKSAEESESKPKQRYEPEPEEMGETKDRSSNKFLYSAVSIVLIACLAFVLYYFVFDSGRSLPEQAEIVQSDQPVQPVKPAIDQSVSDSIEQTNDSILTESSATDIKPEAKSDVSTTKEVKEITQVAQTEASAASAQPSGTQTSTTKTEVPVTKAETPSPKSAEALTSHRLIGADGNPVTVTLNPGERLTIVALNQFGDKSFWPYIFDVNSDRLKAPNLVQAGMKLYLPDPAYFDIDANSAESLRKAKNRAAQLLK